MPPTGKHRSTGDTTMKHHTLCLALATLGLAATPAFAQNTITTAAGNGSSGTPVDGSMATATTLTGPTSIAVIPGGGFYIGDVGGVRKVDAGGVITTFIPTTSPTPQVDGLHLLADGTLYYAVGHEHIVRKRAPNGVITTVAGTGTPGSGGDGGPATSATLDNPTGIDMDSAGNLYIVEYNGCRVRKVSSGGTISTLIGTGTCSSTGDGGLASAATINIPWGVRVDDNTGDIFVTEWQGARIRKIAPNGTVTTFAGNGTLASTGDGGQATAASLGGPLNMDVDAAGNLYVAEFNGHKIRRIAPNGVITTVAGNGTSAATGDGGPALNAGIGGAYTFATANGGYFIAQRDFRRVRFVANEAIQPQDPDPEPEPASSCAEEGYTGTKLKWCQNICESELSDAQIDTWIHRWIGRYRDLPYCAAEEQSQNQ